MTVTAIEWWTCAECGVDAELARSETDGCQVPCPECSATMTAQWQWESTAA